MKIIVVGSDGREYSIVLKLAQSKTVKHIYCAPGSDAIGEIVIASSGERVQCCPFGATDAKQIADFARDNKIDLVVPGPESCLEAGLGDLCRSYGIPFAGPDRRGARLETSKAYSFQFMRDYGIPCPDGCICETIASATRYVREHPDFPSFVFKADGLASGKGVLMPTTEYGNGTAIVALMTGSACGKAGERIVVQKREDGGERSLHFITDAHTALILPTSRDYKREGDGDTGPNTGGMGAYSPADTFFNPGLLNEFGHTLIQQWQRGCEGEMLLYRGMLYPGIILTEPDIMLTKVKPKVLEFNCRWGDPEAQVLLAQFEGDLAELLLASATDSLKPKMLPWGSADSVCVVLASRGYPLKPEINKEITGIEEAAKQMGIDIIHAGTRREGRKWFTNGGRVLGVRATARTRSEARERAYQAVRVIDFEGKKYRTDIAEKA